MSFVPLEYLRHILTDKHEVEQILARESQASD